MIWLNCQMKTWNLNNLKLEKDLFISIIIILKYFHITRITIVQIIELDYIEVNCNTNNETLHAQMWNSALSRRNDEW